MLTVTIVSDFKFFYISDRVLVISAIFLLGIEYYFLGSTEMLYNLAAGVVLFLIMFGIKILGNSMFGRESLGDGDIKLMGVVGIALGIFNSFVALFFSAITALIFSLITLKKNKEGIIPYGPFIIIGALIVVLFGDIINPYLADLFSL